MTLDEFIYKSRSKVGQRADWNKVGQRAHVSHSDFEELYVRYTKRFIQGRWEAPVIDLASVTAKHPGHGAFKRLVAYLRDKYPDCGLYAESVLNPRLQQGLERLGFVNVGPEIAPCFWMPRAG